MRRLIPFIILSFSTIILDAFVDEAALRIQALHSSHGLWLSELAAEMLHDISGLEVKHISNEGHAFNELSNHQSILNQKFSNDPLEFIEPVARIVPSEVNDRMCY